MTDQLPETSSRSGPILKSAREELALSLEQVAHELHLRPSVVKAIEDEDYDEFSSDVFLKGYFRSYCRLVNLHDVRMMELLDKQLLFRKEQAQLEQLKVTKLIQSKKRKKLLITLLVFITCLSLVALTYYISTKDAPQIVPSEKDSGISSKGVPSNKPDEITESTLPTDKLTSIAVEATNTTDSSGPIETQSKLVSGSAKPALKTENVDDLNSHAPTDRIEDVVVGESNGERAGELTGENAVENTAEDTTEKLIADSELKATFSGDCWFKLTDSTGKVVIADLKRNNDTISFSGPKPFHIIIGDASKVSLSLNDAPVDLRPYTSQNGRAELTLNPLKPVNEG